MAVLVKMYRNVIIKLYNFQDCVFGHKKRGQTFLLAKAVLRSPFRKDAIELPNIHIIAVLAERIKK